MVFVPHHLAYFTGLDDTGGGTAAPPITVSSGYEVIYLR